MEEIRWKSSKQRLEDKKLKRQARIRYLQKKYPPRKLTKRELERLMKE